SDLTMQLGDVTGLPLTTELELDPSVPGVQDTCQREECIKVALQSHPEIVAAREELRKASAGVQLAKADYVPDITAFARYSYQSNVPFLAHNFGTFGVDFTYDLFDGGKRRAAVRESEAEVAEAKENLARVSEELYALRAESSRVSAQQLQKGEALQSQAQSAVAQEFDAKTTLLQSQLDYIQARDEVIQAMGLTPE